MLEVDAVVELAQPRLGGLPEEGAQVVEVRVADRGRERAVRDDASQQARVDGGAVDVLRVRGDAVARTAEPVDEVCDEGRVGREVHVQVLQSKRRGALADVEGLSNEAPHPRVATLL